METGPSDRPVPAPKPRKRPVPVPSQVRDTKSNADRARSQPQVRKELARLKTKRSEVKDTKGNADRLPEKQRQEVVKKATQKLAEHVINNPKAFKGTTLVKNLEKTGLVKTLEGYPTPGEVMLANQSAPVLKVLDQTTRPVHAIAGAADAAVTGGNVLKAAKRGIQNKDKTTFSKVLKDLGAPKAVQGVGGFALDIGLDPTTYLTGGSASVAKKEALKAAEKAAARTAAGAERSAESVRRAARPGTPAATVERKAQAAHDEVVAQARPQRAPDEGPRGLDLKFAGKSIPGVTKATAPVGKLAQKASGTRAGQGGRRAVADFNPNMAPAGATRAQADAATSAARTTRAKTQRGVHDAQQNAVALRKALGKDDAQVVHAIETGKINSLPQHLQQPARTLAKHYGQIRKQEKQAGVRGGTRKNYVPHYTNESLKGRAPSEVAASGASVGKRVIRPDSSKARKDGTLAEKTAAKPGVYNEDAALAYVNRMAEGARSVGQATLNRRIAEMGRPVKPGKDLVYDPATEAVFHLKGSDLVAVTDKKELERIATKGHAGKGGTYVVLNKSIVKRAHAIASPSGERSATGAVFDKATGAFKFMATQPNPAFHVRNFIGDTHNAYTAQHGGRMAANMAQAGKTLRALKRDEEAMRTLGKTAKPQRRGITGKTVKLGDGSRMTHADLAQEAAQVGAIRSGFLNQEVPELLKAQGKGIKKVGRNIPGASRAGRAIKRTSQSREDLPRLSTYIEGRKLGMHPEEAARFSMGPHFDYANLTDLERKIRRGVPFYTFTARNIPYQAKVLATKPGKVAAYQKLREEAAIAAGLQPGWEKDQSPWDQRNAGFPVRIGGKVIVITTGDPIADLNEFPVALAKGHPVKQLDEWMQKVASMVNPVFKDPVELFANYSFFFRDQLRSKDAPLVAAPDFVGIYPKWAKDKMGVVQIVDKKTGKKVWAWDAKVNYIAHAVPGIPNTAMNLTSGGTDKAGRGRAAKVAGALGVKATPLDPGNVKINDLYDQLDSIHEELSVLSQRGIKAGDPRRDKLNALTRDLERQVYQAKAKRGDKVLPTAGAPAKLPPLPSIDGGLGGGGMGGGLDGGIG